MQHALVDSQLAFLLRGDPCVGMLVELCEENYDLLRELAPGLRELNGCWHAKLAAHLDLGLEILENHSRTQLIRLTWLFPQHPERSDPDALIRVYHDARSAEILDLKQQALPTESLFVAPGLVNKWRANLFLGKWLSFCVRAGYRFDTSPNTDKSSAGD